MKVTAAVLLAALSLATLTTAQQWGDAPNDQEKQQCLENITRSARTFGNSLVKLWRELKAASGLHSWEETETEFAPPVLQKVATVGHEWVLNSDCSSNGFSALGMKTFKKLQSLTRPALSLPNVDPERVKNKINEASVAAIALQIATVSCFRKPSASGTDVARSVADGFRRSNVIQLDPSIADVSIVCERPPRIQRRNRRNRM